MAKKKKEVDIDYEDNDINLDEFDLDGLDIDKFDEGLGEREPSNLEIAKDIAKETGKGFFESLSKKTLEKSLPNSYSENYYTALEYKDFIENELKTSKQKIQKSLYNLTKETAKALPFKFKLLDKIVEKLGETEERIQEISEQQAQETAIQSTLSSIFDKQIEFTKQIEAERSAEEETRFKIELASSKLQTNILTEISNNISSQTSFTLNIAKEYYKKSLELQLRSFYIQVDLLKIIKEYFKGFSVQFDNIVRNTGLPDFVKLRNIENLKDVIRTETSRSIYSSVFSPNTYLGNLKNKISKAISNKVNDFTSSLDDITFNLSMLNSGLDAGGNAKSLYGGIFGRLLGNLVGEKVAEKLSAKIGNRFKDNKIIKTGGNMLETLAISPATFFSALQKKARKYKEENEFSNSLSGKIFSTLLSPIADNENLFQPDKIDTKVSTERNILDINKPAIFDNKVYSSITDVIPGFLSKIYIEAKYGNKILAKVFEKKIDGIERDQELVYNYINNKFTTIDEYKLAVEKQVFRNKKAGKIKTFSRSAGDRIITEINKNTTNPLKKIGSSQNKRINKDLEILINKLIEKQIPFKLEDLFNDKFIEEIKKDKDIAVLITKDIETMIEKAKKHEAKVKESISLYDEQLKNIYSDYPIETIKKVFSTISTLANNKELKALTLTDDESLVIAKALTNFIYKTSGVIDIDNTASAKIFVFLPNNIDKKLKEKIAIFLHYVRKIRNMGSYERESKLLLILANLDKALRNSLDIDTEVFKTLGSVDNRLFSGEVYAENIVEGTLQRYNQDYIEVKELIEISKTKSKDIKEYEEKNKESFLDDITRNILEGADKAREKYYEGVYPGLKKIKDVFKQEKEAIKSINTPEQAARYLISTITKVYKEASDITKKQYDGALKNLNELINLNKFATLTKGRLKNTLIEILSKTEEKMRNIIDAETQLYNEKIRSLEKTKTTLEEKIKSASLTEEETIEITSITRAIDKEKKLFEYKTKSLNNLLNKLKEIKNTAINIDEENNLLKTLRDKFIEIKNEFITVYKEYSNIEKS